MNINEDFDGHCEVCAKPYIGGSLGVCRSCLDLAQINRMNARQLEAYQAELWEEIKRLSALESAVGMRRINLRK